MRLKYLADSTDTKLLKNNLIFLIKVWFLLIFNFFCNLQRFWGNNFKMTEYKLVVVGGKSNFLVLSRIF